MAENKNLTIGRKGENLATRYLKSNKYIIITRNYYSTFGELDIIAKDNNTLVFVEVKTRTSNLTSALNSVSYAKQQKIIATASLYLNEHPEFENLATRFDVIAIIFKDNKYSLKHLKDAFI